MKNKMDDLRNHLFETLEALKDEDKPMDIDRAKAISNIAGRLIETAKVEVDYLEVTGQAKGSEFLPSPSVERPHLKRVGSD